MRASFDKSKLSYAVKEINIHHPNSLCVEKYPHLEFCHCVVLIVSNLVFHGAEVHRMFDYH